MRVVCFNSFVNQNMEGEASSQPPQTNENNKIDVSNSQETQVAQTTENQVVNNKEEEMKYSQRYIVKTDEWNFKVKLIQIL